MATKHTPGPWSVDPNAPEYVTEDATGYQIANTVQGDHMEPVSEANARLIAAAPELLDALERAQGVINALAAMAQKHNPETGYYNDLNPYEVAGMLLPVHGPIADAIAKAKGQA